MKSPIINPIRFYNPLNTPDYLTKFPNIDNIYNGAGWVYGINFCPNYARFHTGRINLQFSVGMGESLDFELYKLIDNEWVLSDTITATDITPIGWIGDAIILLNVNIADGTYFLNAPNLLRSDIFVITTDARTLKDFVKIYYRNSENDFGCIFGSNSFTSYFMGSLLPGTSTLDIESYEDDRGEPVKLKATPQRTATLNLKGVHYTYADYFVHLFSCDDITINGVDYENTEAPAFDPIQGSDLGSISIKLIQKSNDYYNG